MVSVEVIKSNSIPIAGQLSQTIQAGLPLESGLRALAEQTGSAKTRRALIELCQKLEQGMPLADALRSSSAGLPRQMKALVEAGIESGRLDSVMRYCIEQLQRATSLRQHIWLGLSYPLFLIWFSTLICGLILYCLVPTLGDIVTGVTGIFNNSGTELTAATTWLMGFSSFVFAFGYEPWLILMLSGLGSYAVFLCFGLSNWGQRWTTSIPVVGRVFRLAALTDFCHILATLAESGLSFSKAVRFAGAASDDRWLSRKCQLMADDMDQGTPPSNAAEQVGLPTTLCQVFREANSERTFVQALRALADIYAAQCHVTSQLVNTVVSQFSVAFVLGFVGIVLISMFVPVIRLLKDLA